MLQGGGEAEELAGNERHCEPTFSKWLCEVCLYLIMLRKIDCIS